MLAMRNPYYRQVPYAKKYSISRGGDILSNGRDMRTTYRSGSRYASLYCDDRVRRYVNLKKLARVLFDGEPPPLLNANMITNSLGARVIPEWPRYAITSYGAIYCIEPPKRGYKAQGCYLVSERELRGAMYVTLYAPLLRKTLKVDDLIRSTWNY
jgi:hypothetical protein